MKRPSVSELIHTQPVPASSVRYLHCRPAATDMRYLSRDTFSPENALRIGLTGSGKIFAPQATPDSIPPGPPQGICVDYWDKSCDADPLLYRYLQQTDKRGHHE